MASSYTCWEMGKCLEWYTHLPVSNRPQISPTFFYQNVECYFSFCKGKVLRCNAKYTGSFYDYELYLKTERTDTELKPFSFTVYATVYSDDGEDRFTKHSVYFHQYNNRVFYFSEAPFKSMADNFSCGFPFKYTFVFNNDSLLLPSEVIRGEKGVQTGSYLSGDVCLKRLSDDFSKLLETELNHDFEIKCGEHSLKAHKSVLCARSEVFKTMMQNDFLEGRTGVLHIQDMASCYFSDFLQYLYTGSMRELTFDKAKTLYETGDKYAVRSLMLSCSEYLQDNLSEENIYECFLLADAHSDQKLKDKIKTFIIEKSLYLEDEYWAPFCEKFPEFSTDLYRQLFKRPKIEKK